MSQVVEPNFFMVGAARSGTTSMYEYLRSHPEIFMPATLAGKEPSHFCDLTAPWAARYRDFDAYLSLFSKGRGRAAVGDGSTNYLVSPESARRISQRYPNAKILIILRNPAERAYSLYRYICCWGIEDAPTFEKALAREASRLGNAQFIERWNLLYHAFLYYNSGLYAEQITRYQEAFPREQMHIVLFDDLKKNAADTVSGVYRFLGVDPSFEPELDPVNLSGFPRSVRVQAFLGRRWNGNPLNPKQPRRRRDDVHYPTAMSINLMLGQFRTVTMAADTRRALIERYRPDIVRTAAIIGRSLDRWVEPKVGSPPGSAKAAMPA